MEFSAHSLPKIELSTWEQELMMNRALLLTKLSIIKKIENLFGGVSNWAVEACRNQFLPYAEVWDIPPKISKGELYQQMPWLMLDYPRYFGKTNQFAIRVFFWWGHHIGIYWHTSGSYAKQFLNRIATHPPSDDWEYGVIDDPFNYQFGLVKDANWIDYSTFSEDMFYARMAKKIPIEPWEFVGDKIVEAYQYLLVEIAASNS